MSVLCQPCEVQDQNSNASAWCMLCEAPLCTSCQKYHRVLKATKDHIVIGIEDYLAISDFLSQIQTKCEQHPELDMEYLCSSHKTMFCNLCRKKNHSYCEEIIKIEDENQIKEDYSTLQSLSNILHSNILTMTKLCDDRQINIQKIETQRKEFLEDIKERRNSINMALDTLEKEMKEKFEIGYQFEKRKLEEEHKRYNETNDQLQTKYNQLNKIIEIKPLSAVQAFMAEKHIREQNNKNEKHILDFVENNTESNCRCTISVNISNSNRSIQISDNLEISSIKPRSSLSENTPNKQTTEFEDNITDSSVCEFEDDLHEGRLTGNKTVNINELGHRLENTTVFDKRKSSKSSFEFNCSNHFSFENEAGEPTIKCIKLLPNGTIVCGDCSNSCLLIYDTTGVRVGMINLKRAPRSIAVVDYNLIAVTMATDVVIANIQTFDIEETFSQNDNCYGITVYKNQLVVDCQKKGLKVLDLCGHQTRYYGGFSRVLHLQTINPSTLVYAERGCEVVNFFNIDKKDSNYKKCQNVGITGITTDEEKNVYVSCEKTNSIFIIPRGSSTWKAILTRNDGIDKPKAIDFQNGVLYVINNNGKTMYSYQCGKKK